MPDPAPGLARPPAGKSSGARRNHADGPHAVISRRAADRLRAGHVWVYRSDVENVKTGDEGTLLAVLDPRGQPLGTALYSSESQIALRLVSDQKLNHAEWSRLLRERLRSAIHLRKLAEGTDSCRLVFSEADFLPGLIADKYNDVVAVQLLTPGMKTASARKAIVEVIREQIAPRAILERGVAQEPEDHGEQRTEHLYVADGNSLDPASTVFHLNGLAFHYNAGLGQKTGAFLDQRENYAAAAAHCHGEALDVCSYHGGFALHLARTCRQVTGVDASRPALEVAERNLELNRESLAASAVEWVEANAFDLLRDWSTAGRRFDSIVLDPPAFAKSKRAAEGALRGYKELNLRALKMLRPGGTLVTCSCSHHVGVEEFTSIVAAAAADAHRQVRLIERRGAAPDHPVLLTVPETEYLKCLILPG